MNANQMIGFRPTKDVYTYILDKTKMYETYNARVIELIVRKVSEPGNYELFEDFIDKNKNKQYESSGKMLGFRPTKTVKNYLDQMAENHEIPLNKTINLFVLFILQQQQIEEFESYLFLHRKYLQTCRNPMALLDEI